MSVKKKLCINPFTNLLLTATINNVLQEEKEELQPAVFYRFSNGGKPNIPRNYQLPVELLAYIYQYLPLDDLLNVQSVCIQWQEAASWHLSWRSATFDIPRGMSIDGVKRKLCLIPNLKNIKLNLPNILRSEEFINQLLFYCEDIRKLNCCLHPPLSSATALKIVRQYKKLESITLNMNSTNIIEMLLILSQLTNVKELVFYKSCLRLRSQNSYCKEICEAIATGFKSIRKLNIKSDTYFPEGHTEEDFDAFIYMLRSISSHLLYLRVYITLNVNVIRQIETMVMLRRLKLKIDWDYERNLNEKCLYLELSQMTNLTQLSLNLINNIHENKEYGRYLFQSFCDSLKNNSWSNLQILRLELCSNYTLELSLVGDIIQYLPQLKELELINIGQDIDKQLVNIWRMPYLKVLTLKGYPQLTYKTITHIGKCKFLKCLSLHWCPFIKPGAKHDMLNAANSLLATIVRLKHLEHLSFSGCGLYYLDTTTRNIILKQCEKQNIFLHAFE